MSREDFTIHYDDREIAKDCGCFWDPVKKTWYHPNSDEISKRQRRILDGLEEDYDDRVSRRNDVYGDRDY